MNSDALEQMMVIERKLRIHRAAIVVLAALAIAGWMTGAAAPPSDASFKNIKCRSLKIVDKSGKPALTAETSEDRTFAMQFLGSDGKPRIAMMTGPKQTSLMLFDADEHARIAAMIGQAENDAAFVLSDRNGEKRIAAATLGDGRVLVPIADIKMKQLP